MIINGILMVLSLAVAVSVVIGCQVSAWWGLLLAAGAYVVLGVGHLVCLVVFTGAMPRVGAGRRRRVFHRVICHTARWLMLLCGRRVVLEGADRMPTDRPFLFVSNHLSNFDPLINLAAMDRWPVAFVSKPENFKIVIAGPIMRHASFLPIDRENPRRAVEAIRGAAANITGKALCMGIYPEGTRNKTGGGLLPFHSGSFKIAKMAKAPIVVMTLRYEKGALGTTARLRVVDVMDEAFVEAHRTDALSERARVAMERDLMPEMA